MDFLQVFYALLKLFGGMGVFLYGMKFMGESLENVAGNNIKKMFNKISDKKLIGVGIGTVTTAVIQSSAAVTVMTIGFVNSGIMNLTQATAIIYGANIGTTMTAQIVAFGYSGVKNIDLMTIFAAAAGVGAFMVMFSKSDRTKKIGGIVTGLGMIFVGLAVMDIAMKVFSEAPQIVAIIAKMSNPFVLLIFGVLFTALIQSSSAVSGIVITMSAVGMLTFDQGMFIILGSNIGTCITSLLAAIGTGTNARRTALVHLLFNVIGVTIFGISCTFVPYSKLFTTLFATPQLRIAMLHTFFNVMTVLILLPSTKLLVKLVIFLVPEKKGEAVDAGPRFFFLEEHLLRTPPLAVVQLKREVANMAAISKKNFDMSMEAIKTANVENVSEIMKNEEIINFLNRELTKYLVKLSHTDLAYDDKIMLGTAYHTVSDIERIGDYAENITEYATKMANDGISFSEDAVKEIVCLQDTINKLYEQVMKTYNETTLEYIPLVNNFEDQVDKLKEEMSKRHVERLDAGVCTPEVGAIYLSLSSNAERVADHMTNIAYAVKSYAKPVKAPAQPKA
ncbi:MAG: Na/Pi cotransporter family protein [Clostridia bacterium]